MNRLLTLAAALVIVVALPAAVGAHGEGDPEDGKRAILGKDLSEFDRPASEPLGHHPCEDGHAAIFPCRNVDLMSFVPLEAMGGGTGNDIWGWVDPLTGREYALMGTSNGTAFVDVTDATEPEVVGQMPSQTFLIWALWRDIKVYRGYAFVVSEYDLHGMQIFNLARLRNPLVKPAVFTPDAHYGLFSNAHNIWINEETGFAYVVGTNTCNGGLHMVDVNDPLNPQFAGCFAEDGYTHDVECVIYRGQDGRFRGREICFASNEDTVTIVDVTDKASPRMLSRTGYDSAAYTHQGALTPDHRWFLFGDELDEMTNTVPNTTTYIMELRRLTEPSTPVPFHHETQAIDHNMYIHGNHVYQSNYVEGLRILEYDRRSLSAGQLREVAYFDVVPGVDIDEFAGTWSNYRFPSGTVVVSTIESGLFVLRPTLG